MVRHPSIPLSDTIFILLPYENVSGHLVRRVYCGELEAGYRCILLDGRDESGKELGSGVYFLRMEAPGYVGTRKVLIMR